MAQGLNSLSLILSAYQNGKLAPFYIIRPPMMSSGSGELISSWAQRVCQEVFKLENQREISKEDLAKGYADFIFIEKEKDQKEYKVKDQAVSDFIKAHNYPSLQFKYKLIFVQSAEAISDIILNKWLKILEEPDQSVVTFFLVGNEEKLLDTIESRAITLRLKAEKPPNFSNISYTEGFPHFLKQKLGDEKESLSEKTVADLSAFTENPLPHLFLEVVKNNRATRNFAFEAMLDFAAARDLPYLKQYEILKEIEWFKKSQTFNNSASERFYGLLHNLLN